MQIVFQNPDSALNRSHTVRRLVGRALSRLAGLSGAKREERLRELTDSVRLQERYLGVRPSALSGGLKQRVAIARAFAGDPRLVVCDEPTSALDVSVQAAILNLLADLQREKQTSYLFISHDLGVVRYLSDRIAVLYLGPADGDRPGRGGVRGAAPPVHRGAAVGHPVARRRARADPADGRDPERRQPAVRLRVPHALPAAAADGICETEEPPLAEVAPGRADALPHPARGAAGAADGRAGRRRRGAPSGLSDDGA